MFSSSLQLHTKHSNNHASIDFPNSWWERTIAVAEGLVDLVIVSGQLLNTNLAPKHNLSNSKEVLDDKLSTYIQKNQIFENESKYK